MSNRRGRRRIEILADHSLDSTIDHSQLERSEHNMSARQRFTSPPKFSSRPNRSSHLRDRPDRDRRRERDGERYERDRRERDEYRSSGPGRRDRDYDSKRGSRRSASPPSRSSRKPRDLRSKSPLSKRKRSRSRSRSRPRRSDGDDDKVKDEDKKEEDKGRPNFGNSGLLAAATKTVKTGEGKNVVLKYHEPPEARKPLLGWRLYVFKGGEQVGGHRRFIQPAWINSLPRSTAYSQAKRISYRTRQSCC